MRAYMYAAMFFCQVHQSCPSQLACMSHIPLQVVRASLFRHLASSKPPNCVVYTSDVLRVWKPRDKDGGERGPDAGLQTIPRSKKLESLCTASPLYLDIDVKSICGGLGLATASVTAKCGRYAGQVAERN